MSEARHGRSLWTAALAAVAGVVVGAGGAMAFSATASAGSSTALTLPETLGDLRPAADVATDLGRDDAEAESGRVLDELTDKLSAAYGDAGAAGASYADDEMLVQVRVFAVAAASPGLWSSQDADAMAERLGLARPVEWVERDGDAECLVRQHASLSRAGTDPADVEFNVLRCQLVVDDLTVSLEGSPQLELEQAFDLVREAADGVQRT